MRCIAALLCAISLGSGCGDDGVPADASPDTTAEDAGDGGPLLPSPPVPPMPAALPDLTPCGEGFVETVVGETIPLTICAPTPDEDCPAGEHLFNEGCRAIGSACPSGRFADSTGIASPIYVDPTAAADGDGSEASPFITLADALAVAADGDTLLLSMGEHVGGVSIDAGVALLGACPTGTTITSGTEPGGIITTTGDGVSIANLRITGNGFGVLVNAGSTSITGVDVDATQNVGVVDNGGTLTLEDVAIHDTQITSAALGLGLVSMGDSHVTARRISLVRNATFSAGANAGGVLEMEDVRIVDSLPPAPDGLGVAISAVAGSTITCERCAFERSLGLAVDAGGAGSSVTLVDSRVDEVVQVASEEMAAFGVLARDGAHVTLTRTAVTRTAVGSVVLSNGASGDLTDVVIHDGRIDVGLVAYARTNVVGQRVAIDHTSGVALHMADPGAVGSFTDLTIVDARPREVDGVGGRGLDIRDGVTLTLERARIEHVIEVAVLVDVDCILTATDLSIRDTVPRMGVGRGINIQGASRFEGERIEILDSSEVGLFAYAEGTTTTLRDIQVSDTLARDCPDGSCLSGGGMGFVVFDQAVLEASSFLLARNALVGLQLVDAEVTWSDGVVREHPIGVNIQFAAVDATTLTENVVYIDNGQNLDATELPTPAPTMGTGL